MNRGTKVAKPKEVPHLAQQSPIDLGNARPVHVQLPLDFLAFRWKALKDGVYDHNGGEPQIVFSPDPKVGILLRRPGQAAPTFFPIKAYHFHSPSEHRVYDRDWPLELHIVHETKEADPFRPGLDRPVQAILSVFFTYGKGTTAANKFFRGLSSLLAEVSVDLRGSTQITIATPTNPKSLLPASLENFYCYEGSLTTDTHNENAETASWVVFQEPKSLDRSTLDAYIVTLAHECKEPQPLNRRFVMLNTPKPLNQKAGATS